MNTFHYYRNVRHNIIRTFISHGIDVRAAITKVRINSPYLFATATKLQGRPINNYTGRQPVARDLNRLGHWRQKTLAI